MRIRDSKRYFVLFYMLGFFIGILYTNILAKDYIAAMGIFNEYFLSQYSQMEVNIEEFLWYVIRIRVVPVVLVCALGCTRMKKGVVTAFLLWTGFSSGMILTSAVMKMGVKGIILCLIGMTPHFFCYVAAYMILLWFLFHYPQGKWTLPKTVCFLLLAALGILLECYVNPILMKMFLNTL